MVLSQATSARRALTATLEKIISCRDSKIIDSSFQTLKRKTRTSPDQLYYNSHEMNTDTKPALGDVNQQLDC